jgi:hypothetical protein
MLKPEIFSQINSTGLRTRSDMLRRALFQDNSIIEDISPITDPQGLAHIVIRDKNADAVGTQMTDDLLDFTYRNGIYTRKGLVQEEKKRREHQGASNLYSPALPS